MANYTASQIATLRAAIASGVLTVRHGDELITYQSLTEMRKVLREMERDYAGTPDLKRTLVVFKRGTGDAV